MVIHHAGIVGGAIVHGFLAMDTYYGEVSLLSGKAESRVVYHSNESATYVPPGCREMDQFLQPHYWRGRPYSKAPRASTRLANKLQNCEIFPDNRKGS